MEGYFEKTLACPPVNLLLTTATRTLFSIGEYLQELLDRPSPIPYLTNNRTLIQVGGDFEKIITNPRPAYGSEPSTRALLKTSNVLGQVLTSSSLQAIGLAILFIAALAHLLVGYFTQVRYPPNLPRVREPAGATRFSLKTRWAYYTDCKALYKEAYDTASPPYDLPPCTH